VLALVVLLPLVWLVSTSLKGPSEDIFTSPPALLPSRPSLEAYGRLFRDYPMGTYLLNSALVSGVAVVARIAADQVPTVANRALSGPALTPADSFAGASQPHLWALSAAEVYFRRPPDAAPRTEYASLFNPYWQVRLIAPTAAQRLLAQGYQR
jgi:hypothetical protein